MSKVLDWLLEPDNPSARYLTLTGLLGRPPDDPEALAAREAIPGRGPAKAILDAQWPEGYWMHPGLGYSPRHKATVWQVIFLAQLGTPRTGAVERTCAYVLDHSRLPDSLFSAPDAAPRKSSRGAALCLSGSLLRALWQLDYPDPRLEESLEVLANTAIGDRFRCRCNPGLRPAHPRDGQPCAWGVVKVLGALAELPVERRSPAMQAALEAGVAFLLSGEGPVALLASPAGGNWPGEPWLRLSFPLGHNSDLVEVLELLDRSGLGSDPRLAPAVEAVRSRQAQDGRWRLEHTPDNTWASFGRVGQPNKWVTLRALRVVREP